MDLVKSGTEAENALPEDLLDAQKGAIFLALTASYVCEIVTLPKDDYTTRQVVELVRQLREKQPACFAAIQNVAPELRATREAPARFGSIVAASGHEAALNFERAVYQEVWMGAALMEWLTIKFDSAERMDFGRIIENYDAVQQHFATKVWPNAQEIIDEVRFESGKAAEERLRRRASDG